MGTVGVQLSLYTEILAADNPLMEIKTRFGDLVDDLSQAFASFDPIRVIEVARLHCLPWSIFPHALSEGGFTRAEVITLLAITSHDSAPTKDTSRPPQATALKSEAEDKTPQPILPLYETLSPRVKKVDTLLHLSQVQAALNTDPADQLAFIATKIRSAEIWLRNSSYPEQVEATIRQLFSNHDVDIFLQDSIGFGVDEAFRTLEGCHQMQVNRFNDRYHRAGGRFRELTTNHTGNPTDSERAQFTEIWKSFSEPENQEVTLSAEEIGKYVDLETDIVLAVLSFFSLDLGTSTPYSVIDAFITGNNPLRTSPVICSSDGRFMLVHNAHIGTAIRERFEDHLKTSSHWEKYQKHRGDILEERTKNALSQVFLDAQAQHSFDYYIPATEEEASGPVEQYTKRVEGDHLFIVDDVAIIVEDKAVAIAPHAKSGNTKRLHKDLKGIIEKASAQALRLSERIERDQGIRLRGEEWIDLSSIREIHTIAVSLEDLTATTTGTADLVRLGLIDKNHITWTVSVHDLDIITDLIDHPSEFLLYLRRRTDPSATLLYSAVDELDLFLYFQRSGLYVEPDPTELQRNFPALPEPSVTMRRRYKKQTPIVIPSLTEDLDAWHYQRMAPTLNKTIQTENGHEIHAPRGLVKKPTMATTPLQSLLSDLQVNKPFAWTSIGATLLSGDTQTQKRLAQIPHSLLNDPNPTQGRQAAIPMRTLHDGGWLLAWMTRIPSKDPDTYAKEMRRYIRAKAHQWGLTRAAAFIYDEKTGLLSDTLYESHVGEPTPEILADLDKLQPAGAGQSLASIGRKNRSAKQSDRKRKKKRRPR